MEDPKKIPKNYTKNKGNQKKYQDINNTNK